MISEEFVFALHCGTMPRSKQLKIMKAAILESLDNLSVREVPEPEIDDDAALMRVEAVSICGSDVRILHHGNPRVKPPTIIGHENSGVVVKTGKNVTRVREGDRVSIGADVPCGQCRWCRDGLGTTATSTTLLVTKSQGRSRNI